MQKERIVTISLYSILKNFSGVSIPKLEEFLGIATADNNATVDDIKQMFVDKGVVIQ